MVTAEVPINKKWQGLKLSKQKHTELLKLNETKDKFQLKLKMVCEEGVDVEEFVGMFSFLFILYFFKIIFNNCVLYIHVNVCLLWSFM